MTPVQIILIAALVLLRLYAYKGKMFRAIDPVLFTLMFMVGVALVFFPDLTTGLANALGVGRGVDLLFYLAILGFLFIFLKLYMRIRSLESKIEDLIRQDSIRNARNPDEIISS